MLEDGLYQACQLHPRPRGPRGLGSEDADETAFSIKSGDGGLSLASDFVVVTRRSSGGDVDNGDAADAAAGSRLPGTDSPTRDAASKAASSSTTAPLDAAFHGPGAISKRFPRSGDKEDSGISGSGESLPTTTTSSSRGHHFKASLKAPKRRVGGGRDRSASPLMLLNKEDLCRRDQEHQEAETQSLSSLCVEPPLSVNDNLEDRMEDLSLDEDEVGIETLNEEEGEDDPFGTELSSAAEAAAAGFGAGMDAAYSGADAVAAFSADNESVKTSEFPGTGEDALLDEIDRMMSASSKGKDKLGLDDGISDEGIEESGGVDGVTTNSSSPDEDADAVPGGEMKHSESKASILSERSSANLAARAAHVKTKIFDVWKGGWGFGSADAPSPKNGSGHSSPSHQAPLPTELMSQTPSVERLSLDFLHEDDVSSWASPPTPTKLAQDDFGFPLTVFEGGCLCYPYASLQHLDVLQSPHVRGFLVGANNVLFKQKTRLADVVVDVRRRESTPEEEDGAALDAGAWTLDAAPLGYDVEWRDADLKRVTALTTADLRFADSILRKVEASENEGVWEGGDEWIRAKVKAYLQALLLASLKGDPQQLHDFGPAFVFALQNAHHYRVWRERGTGPEAWPGLDATGDSTHPGSSPHLSVGDIKLKVSHSMSSTQSGRKVAAAAATTGKAVVSTGKAVGGAIVNARTSLSTWWHGGKRTKYEEDDQGRDADGRDMSE